jgi:hypothetical protein
MKCRKLDLSGLGYVQMASCCEHCNEPLGSIEFKDFFDYLKHQVLVKEESAPWS